MSAEDQRFIEQLQLAQADEQAWGKILESERMRLRGMIDARMHSQLRGRIDSSDIIQETRYGDILLIHQRTMSPLNPVAPDIAECRRSIPEEQREGLAFSPMPGKRLLSSR